MSLGDTVGALSSYRKAETLAAAAGPSDFELIAILVRARRTIAQIESRAGHDAEAVILLQSTIEPARRLSQNAPAGFLVDGNPAAEVFVETNLTLGYAMLNSANAANSVAGFRQALQQLRETKAMAEKFQGRYAKMSDLAGKCSQYAGYTLEGLARLTGDPAYFRDSVVAHRESAQQACRTSESRPGPQWRRNCGDGLGELSWALHNAGAGEEAVNTARRSLALMQQLAKEEPRSAETRQDLSIAYMHLGAAENSAGSFGQAIQDLRTAESSLPPINQAPSNDPLGTVELYLNIHRELADALLTTRDSSGAAEVLQQAVAAAQGRATIANWELADLDQRLHRAQK